MAGKHEKVSLEVIGRIHTPFKDPESIPIQGTANTAKGTVALAPDFADGLADLDGFDRIWLLYLAHTDQKWSTRVIPRLDTNEHGIFATRSMLRPNPIGLTCVTLIKVVEQTIHVEGIDMLDGSKLLDIKPYVPRFDAYPQAWSGWLEHSIPHQNAWRDSS